MASSTLGRENERKTLSIVEPNGENTGYNVLVKCGVQVTQGLSREPKTAASLLHSNGLVSDRLLEEITELNATKFDNGQKLYTAVLDVVKCFPHRYTDLVSVLEQNPLLYNDLLAALREAYFEADPSGQDDPLSSFPLPQTLPTAQSTDHTSSQGAGEKSSGNNFHTLENLSDYQPINDDLIIYKQQKMGQGAFGVVFKGSYKGNFCAVKVLHHFATEITTDLPGGDGADEAVKAFRKECDFIKSLDHLNIVRCLSVKRHPKSGNTILVTELMDCNLRSYLSSFEEESLSIDCQGSILKDVASGLAYIHSKKIIHRDLCGDNILLKHCQPSPTAKISDFGMSRLVDCTQLTHTLTAMGHRMGYLPPEAPRLDAEKYDHSLDVFSFGVIIVQIIHKLRTIKSKNDRVFYAGQIESSHPYKALIEICLQEDMSDRPTAQQICAILAGELAIEDCLHFSEVVEETAPHSGRLLGVVTRTEKFTAEDSLNFNLPQPASQDEEGLVDVVVGSDGHEFLFSQDSFHMHVGQPHSLTVLELQRKTGVTDKLLDQQIDEIQISKISAFFDNVDYYVEFFSLTPAEKTYVKDLAFRSGTHIAMAEALRLWRRPNPFNVTYRALIKILLCLRRGDIALSITKHLQDNYSHNK